MNHNQSTEKVDVTLTDGKELVDLRDVIVPVGSILLGETVMALDRPWKICSYSVTGNGPKLLEHKGGIE